METNPTSAAPPAPPVVKPATDGAAPGGTPKVQPAPILPASGAPKSPAPFGGHRGAKKTKSGFPVDSPEHAEWTRKREADRSQRRRDEAARLTAPPVLPSSMDGVRKISVEYPPTPPGDVASAPPPSVAGGAVPLPAAGAGGAVAGVVAWSQRMLSKPAALVLRIVDRLRKIQLHRRIDKLGLTPGETAEVKKDLEWQESAKRDFEDALAEVSALGLNKAGVSAEYSPYINVTLAGGELVLSHLAALDRLEKMYQLRLTAMAKKPDEKTGTETK